MRFQSSCSTAFSRRDLRARAARRGRGSATRRSIAAPMIMPSAIRNVILRNGSPGCSQPIETKYGIIAQPTSPPTSAAMPMRAPTIMPAPNVDADSSIAPSAAILAAPMPPTMPSAMPPNSRDTDRRSRTGSVSARRMLATASPDGKRELQAVDEDRRVEHADADAEHADAQHVEDELPRRRLRHAQPDHRLDDHRHRAHAGDRGRRRLDVVGAVTSGRRRSRTSPSSRGFPRAPGRRRRSPARSSCTTRRRRRADRG